MSVFIRPTPQRARQNESFRFLREFHFSGVDRTRVLVAVTTRIGGLLAAFSFHQSTFSLHRSLRSQMKKIFNFSYTDRITKKNTATLKREMGGDLLKFQWTESKLECCDLNFSAND